MLWHWAKSGAGASVVHEGGGEPMSGRAEEMANDAAAGPFVSLPCLMDRHEACAGNDAECDCFCHRSDTYEEVAA
jgi:hypothetical protein